MQYFVYFTMSEDKPMKPPTPEGMAKMSQFMQKCFEEGRIVATGRLPREVTNIELSGEDFSVSDGPFIEGKEMIPGFTIFDAPSKHSYLL